jgi:hypothetical protein
VTSLPKSVQQPDPAPEASEIAERLDQAYRARAMREATVDDLDGFASLPAGWGSYEVQWRLARAMFVAGDLSPNYFGDGIKHGLRAIGLEPDRVEGHFWLGVNQALCAEHRGGFVAALLVLKARRHLRRAVAISESYHGAGPLRVLARLAHKAPWFLGGSRKRSEHYSERALAIAPTNSVTLLYAAELAVDGRDFSKAARLLHQILDSPIDPEWESENVRDKQLARSLLAGIN